MVCKQILSIALSAARVQMSARWTLLHYEPAVSAHQLQELHVGTADAE